MMRMSATILTLGVAFAVALAAAPDAEAGQKRKGSANSNLASGDITLLEQAFGTGKSSNLRRISGANKAARAWRKVKYFNTTKKLVRDYY